MKSKEVVITLLNKYFVVLTKVNIIIININETLTEMDFAQPWNFYILFAKLILPESCLLMA